MVVIVADVGAKIPNAIKWNAIEIRNHIYIAQTTRERLGDFVTEGVVAYYPSRLSPFGVASEGEETALKSTVELI